MLKTDTARSSNTANGKTVVATVQDECPTCNVGTIANDLDLSLAAFNAIGDQNTGVVRTFSSLDLEAERDADQFRWDSYPSFGSSWIKSLETRSFSS